MPKKTRQLSDPELTYVWNSLAHITNADERAAAWRKEIERRSHFEEPEFGDDEFKVGESLDRSQSQDDLSDVRDYFYRGEYRTPSPSPPLVRPSAASIIPEGSYLDPTSPSDVYDFYYQGRDPSPPPHEKSRTNDRNDFAEWSDRHPELSKFQTHWDRSGNVSFLRNEEGNLIENDLYDAGLAAEHAERYPTLPYVEKSSNPMFERLLSVADSAGSAVGTAAVAVRDAASSAGSTLSSAASSVKSAVSSAANSVTGVLSRIGDVHAPSPSSSSSSESSLPSRAPTPPAPPSPASSSSNASADTSLVPANAPSSNSSINVESVVADARAGNPLLMGIADRALGTNTVNKVASAIGKKLSPAWYKNPQAFTTQTQIQTSQNQFYQQKKLDEEAWLNRNSSKNVMDAYMRTKRSA